MDSEKIRRYLEISTSGGADLHPNKSELVYLSNETGISQVYKMDLSNKQTTQLTDADNRATNPVYLPDGKILYSSDEGGNENFQFFIIDGKSSYRLTQDLSVKHRYVFSTKEAIYFSANLDDKGRFDVYRYDLPVSQQSEPIPVKQGQEGMPLSPAVASDDNRYLILSEAISNLATDLMVFDAQSSESRVITTFKNHNARFIVKEFLDNNTLLITTDYKREFLSLALFNIETAKITFLEEDQWDTGRVVVDEEKTLYFGKNVDGMDRLYTGKLMGKLLVNIEELPIPARDGTLVAGDHRTFLRSFVVSKDEKRLLMTFSSPTIPASVWMIELEKGELTQLTSTPIEGLEPFQGLNLQRFDSFDGETIPYFLYEPEGSGPFPAVFVIHGGPEAQMRTTFLPLFQLLLSEGYIVVAPNIRGSAGYGRRYYALDDIEKRLDSIKDINALAEHLKTNPKVDGKRLIVYGGSYGGFAVLSSITEFPGQFAAAVDIVGISNFVTFLKNTATWRRRIREVEYGFLDKHLDFLESISPSNKIDSVKTPTIIIQGDNDERVPLSESIQVHEMLQKNDVPTKLVRFADEGHGVVKRKNQIVMYTQIFKFLEEQLR